MNQTKGFTSSSPLALVLLLALGVLLPALYVGSYLALHEVGEMVNFVKSDTGTVVQVSPFHRYRLGNGYVNHLYWPLEQLHERIESTVWDAKLLPYDGKCGNL